MDSDYISKINGNARDSRQAHVSTVLPLPSGLGCVENSRISPLVGSCYRDATCVVCFSPAWSTVSPPCWLVGQRELQESEAFTVHRGAMVQFVRTIEGAPRSQSCIRRLMGDFPFNYFSSSTANFRRAARVILSVLAEEASLPVLNIVTTQLLTSVRSIPRDRP